MKFEELANKLHPWFYPVQIGDKLIEPGIGSNWDSDRLSNRIIYRSKLLIDEVCKRVDMKDKSVLELACNCAYWSAEYVKRGASRVVGIEGRILFLQQAELYWTYHKFLPNNKYKFISGNVSESETWDKIKKYAPFDIVLCAGILYHIPNYERVLSWSSEVTRETMIVDTRVGDVFESFIREPKDLHFNAINQTMKKRIPNLTKLISCIKNLNFTVEVLPVTFKTPPGLTGIDDYNRKKRVTILALRK